MAIQLSTTLRNARNDQVESHIGASPTLEIRTGAQPANCAAADSGTLLVSMALPSDWRTSASSGSSSKNGTWQGTAGATGTGAHFRIKQGATCHVQGTVGMGSGDLSLDNTSIASGQVVTCTQFDLAEVNA
jgi:hypothetical protein